MCIAVLSAAVAEDFWQKKPYPKWSKSETEKLLTESPWSHSVVLSAITMLGVGRATGRTQTPGQPPLGVPATDASSAADTGRQSTPQITYTAQLRSAQPVREAVVRQLQLQAKYDSLSPEQKTAIDERTNQYLNQPQGDAIVVYVRFASNTPNYLSDIRRYWMQQNAELLKTTALLNIGGQRLSPVAYVASDDAFQLTFQRPADIPSSGSVVVEFMHPQVGAINSEHIVFDFKLDKMRWEGNPAI